MSTKTRLLCQAAVLAGLTSAAYAQDAVPVQGTAAPATAPAAAPADDEIIVTGIRASLRSAEGIKRNAAQIIDSVVAEDIGKLPDISVADSAARIAGVQVYRQGGEAQSVLVRGLPFFETTYDGREIFTAETRVVALQDFPSQNVAALQVYKTATADLVEPGLAGSINVVSRRPFDFSGFTVSASGQGNYGRNSGQWRPQGNFLISDRWQTGAGEMGLLVNASFTELRYLDNELSNTDFIATPTVNGQVVRVPDVLRLFDRSGDRARPSVNAAFQWKPTPELQFYAGVLWQGFRNRIDDRLLEADLYNAISYNNLTFRPNTNLVTGGTIVAGNQPFTFQGATYNKTDTFQYSGGLKWDSGRLHGTVDVARTNSTVIGSTESLDRRFLGTPTITFNNNTPQFSITGLTAPNAANGFLFQGLFEENQRSAGRGWQGRADLTYDVDNEFLKDVQFGLRYTDRSVYRNYANRYAFLLPAGINASSLPIGGAVFTPGFAGTDVQGFRNWYAPSYGSFRDNIGQLRQFVIDHGGSNYTLAPVVDPSLYTSSEQTVAGYVQTNWHIGDVVDGTAGVRIVDTRDRTITTSDYLEALPSASARIKFTRKLQGRLAYSETRTLPDFNQLGGSNTITYASPPNGIIGSGTPSNPQIANRGNSSIKAYKSTNYDASLEYYATSTSFIAASYFHRDLQGFIQNQTQNYLDPIYGYVQLSFPVNTGKGHIDGVEIQGQSFLDIQSLPKWVRGFGAQASVTFINAKTQQFDPTLNGGLGGLRYDYITDQLVGTSKFLYSVQAIYDQGPLSLRATLNGRSSFHASTQYRGFTDPVTRQFVLSDKYYEIGKPTPRLDLSANYSIREKATLFFDWTNVTATPFKQYFSSARDGAPRAEYVRYIRYDESVISAGVRFRY